MIQSNDLQAYIDLFKTRHTASVDLNEDIATILWSSTRSLFGSEFGQIAKMASIAAHADEIELLAAQTAKVIYQEVRIGNCLELSRANHWRKAILVAENKIKTQNYPVTFADREGCVANAYKRLKKSNRKLSINALGILWDEASLKDACGELNAHISLFGGVEAIAQIGRVFDDSNNIYDKIWLCGETNLGVHQANIPTIPFGWLMSLSVKHTHRKGKPRKPKVLWQTIVETSRDIAATYDCQRYSQFDGMGIGPTDFDRVIYQALAWRELFTVQQMPQECLPYLRDAFLSELSSTGDTDAHSEIEGLWNEYGSLLRKLSPSKPSLFKKQMIKSDYPLLFSLSSAARNTVNTNYAIPVSGVSRNDSNIMFYPVSDENFIALPLSISNTVFLRIVFMEIIKKFGKASSKLLSNVTERAIASACEGKADTVFNNKKYIVGKTELEFDVATKSHKNITLIEIKNKAITKKSESGDRISFMSDISKSALPLIYQLARHQKHIRRRETPLNDNGAADDFSITKIAVSTLTYGPIADNLLITSIFQSLVNCKVSAVSSENEKTIKAFNKEYRKALNEIFETCKVNNKGEYDLHSFFISTRWMDMGQLIYLLHRSKKVSDTLRPIKHVTFSSRDIWNEIAYADRAGLAEKYWSAIS